jgi:hypothetical protein
MTDMWYEKLNAAQVDLYKAQIGLYEAEALERRAQAAKLLADAGYHRADILKAVGLLEMKVS